MVTFVADVACPTCDHPNPALMVASVHINKTTLRTTGVFGGIARVCRRCREPMPDLIPDRWQLDEE